MARTSKTVIGRGSSQRNAQMADIAARGAQQRSRGEAAIRNEGARGAAAIERQGQHAAGLIQNHERQQFAEEQAGIQNDMARRRMRLQEGQAVADYQMGQRQQAMREGQVAADQDFRQQQIDLQAADKGLERRQALEAEMARGAQETSALPQDQLQRIQEQGDQPIEMGAGAGNRFQPTEKRLQNESFAQQAQAEKLATERMRAQAYTAQTVAQLDKARRTGSVDEAKQLSEQLMQPVRSDVKRFDRFMNGENSAADWSALQKMGADVPDPTLQQDLESQNFSPRVQKFLSAKIAESSLKFIEGTGDLPDGEIVDLSSPKMQEFSRATQDVSSYMRSMPGIGQFMNVKSTAEKTRFVNKMAARMVMSGTQGRMEGLAAQPAQNPMAGMAPSAGDPVEEGGEIPSRAPRRPMAPMRQGIVK